MCTLSPPLSFSFSMSLFLSLSFFLSSLSVLSFSLSLSLSLSSFYTYICTSVSLSFRRVYRLRVSISVSLCTSHSHSPPLTSRDIPGNSPANRTFARAQDASSDLLPTRTRAHEKKKQNREKRTARSPCCRRASTLDEGNAGATSPGKSWPPADPRLRRGQLLIPRI